MTSVTTSYFYTLIALGSIGLLVTATFQAQTVSLRNFSEIMELERLLQTIAAEGTELIALTEAKGASTRVLLHLPQKVGESKWWARLVSDNSSAWVEGAFGTIWDGRPELRVDLPWNVSASGSYEGGVGTLSLACEVQGSDIILTLNSWEAG